MTVYKSSFRCKSLVPHGEFAESPDPWLTHNIIVHTPHWSEIKYLTPLIMHWLHVTLTPGHTHLWLADSWSRDTILASDWPAEECHMSQVTYLECVTESGRTAHNLAFFVSCQLSGDINTGDSQIHCCNASLSPLLVHWKRWENGLHSFILSKI